MPLTPEEIEHLQSMSAWELVAAHLPPKLALIALGNTEEEAEAIVDEMVQQKVAEVASRLLALAADQP